MQLRAETAAYAGGAGGSGALRASMPGAGGPRGGGLRASRVGSIGGAAGGGEVVSSVAGGWEELGELAEWENVIEFHVSEAVMEVRPHCCMEFASFCWILGCPSFGATAIMRVACRPQSEASTKAAQPRCHPRIHHSSHKQCGT